MQVNHHFIFYTLYYILEKCHNAQRHLRWPSVLLNTTMNMLNWDSKVTQWAQRTAAMLPRCGCGRRPLSGLSGAQRESCPMSSKYIWVLVFFLMLEGNLIFHLNSNLFEIKFKTIWLDFFLLSVGLLSKLSNIYPSQVILDKIRFASSIFDSENWNNKIFI